MTLSFLAGYPERLLGGPQDDHYLPGRIIVKLEPDGGEHYYNQSGEPNTAAAMQRLKLFLEPYDLTTITPVFGPQALSKVQNLKQSQLKISAQAIRIAGSLQRTYTITYGSGDDPVQVAAGIEKMEGVIYAEPHYTHQTAGLTGPGYHPADKGKKNSMGLPFTDQNTENKFIPNDPFIGKENHNYFEYLNIFNAWGINRGSADVVIAIIDTGVFYDHPDLKANLWRNPEPGRANEYFPEFEIRNDTIGWNFWESGNIYKGESPVQNADPVGNYSTHGTMVTGIAAAATDNATGIAGVGFRSRFMPVKTGGTQDYPDRIAFAYHGILYAAINDADVINCSFIGAGRSNFGAEAIQFAQEMGAVVVAAIGNNGISTRGAYPASFDDVISVGAVSSSFDDRLTVFSSYGPTMDVFAVGQNMLSTTFEFDDSEEIWSPGYHSTSGTSLAVPIVSGLAALLKAEYPDWPPQRISSQIRGTARSIYHANPGSQYQDQLGRGVIDAYAALTENIPLISLTNHAFYNEQNQKISVGESGSLRVEGIHFGNLSPEILFELESLQPGITIHTPQISRSGLEPGENIGIDFSLSINENYQLDTIPAFRLTWSIEDLEDQSYQGIKIIEYEELLFGIMDNNRLTMTIPSDGTIGFMHPEDQSIGFGFIPNGYENILPEAGFMISGNRNGEQMMINQVRDSTGITRHFQPVKNFRFRNHSGIRNAQFGSAEFHSVNHHIAKELEIEVEAISLNTADIDRSLFLNFRITNNSDHVYNDIKFGIFNRWRFRESGAHHTFFSEEENLMYLSHESGPPFAGIAATGNITGALAIDNQSTMTLDRAESRSDSLSFGIAYQEGDERMDGFTDAEKLLALTSARERTTLSAEDISMVIATGPYTLYPHSEVTIGFIYAWELTADRLKNQLKSALSQEFLEHDLPGGYTHTGRMADELTLHPNFPNPFNNRTSIRLDLMESKHVELDVYDLLGRHVVTLVNEYREKGPHFLEFDAAGLASGTYMVILKTDEGTKWDKMMLVK